MIHHKDTENTKVRANILSKQVIGAAIEVHRALGPGLLESTYEECLCHELLLRQLPFKRQLKLPLEYKGLRVESAYRLDLLIDNLLIVELKSVDRMDPIFVAQLFTYLRLTNLWLGLLINFNVAVLKNGVTRLVNG